VVAKVIVSLRRFMGLVRVTVQGLLTI